MKHALKEMTQHSWKKLDNFPLVFVLVFSIGILLPFIIALSNGHVTPYVPYISEGGGEFPEAGLFSTCMSVSAILSQWIIILRYLIMDELNSVLGNNTNTFLNKISLVLGIFSTLALIVVASFPTSTISQVHNAAAGGCSVCFVIYLLCQTLMSFRIFGKTKLSYGRLVITICSIVSLVLVTTFGLLGSSEWRADYWAGKKSPEDKGFLFYLISASFEWLLALFLVLYFSTFITEFKKSTLNFKMEIAGITQSKPTLSNLDIRGPRF